jgi:hypothetical protein
MILTSSVQASKSAVFADDTNMVLKRGNDCDLQQKVITVMHQMIL